jgi:hypothetical protein
MRDICNDNVGAFLNAVGNRAVDGGGGSQETSVSHSSDTVSLSRHPSEIETLQAGPSGTLLASPGSPANAIHKSRPDATLKSRARCNVEPQQGAELPDDLDLPRLKSKARFIAGSAGKSISRLLKYAYNKFTFAGAGVGIAVLVALGKGALIGGALGSIAPGVGNIVGAVLGGIICAVSPAVLCAIVGAVHGAITGSRNYTKFEPIAREAQNQLLSYFAGETDIASLEQTLKECDQAKVPLAFLRKTAEKILQGYDRQTVAEATTLLRDRSYAIRRQWYRKYQRDQPGKTFPFNVFELKKLAPSLHAVLQGARSVNVENLYQNQTDPMADRLRSENIRMSTAEKLAGGQFGGVYAAKFQGGEQKWIIKFDHEQSKQLWPDGDSSCLTETELTQFTSKLGEKWSRNIGRNPCGAAYLSKFKGKNGPELATVTPFFNGKSAADIYQKKPSKQDQPADVANSRESISWAHAFDYVVYHADRHGSNAIIEPESGHVNLIDNGVCMGEGMVPDRGSNFLAPLSTMILSQSQAREITTQWKADDIQEAAEGLGLSNVAVNQAKQRLWNLQRAIDNNEVNIIPDGGWTSDAYGRQWRGCAAQWYSALLNAHQKMFPVRPHPGNERDYGVYQAQETLLNAFAHTWKKATPEMLSGGRRLNPAETKAVRNFANAARELIKYAETTRRQAARDRSFRHPLSRFELPVTPPPAILWEMKYYSGR